MTKEELLSKIETFVNGILDTLSQDKNSIVKRIDEELKDFIVTVGYDCAESREKRIAELERKLEQTEKDLFDYQFNYPTIKELQKENAELKEKCKTLEDMLDEGISYQKAKDYDGVVTSLLEQNHLFTRAKELLKKWVELYKPKLEGYSIPPIQEQIEQFLKEIKENDL